LTSLARLAMGNATLFALVSSRIVGFVAVSPFPGQNVGRTQRVGLVVVLSWVATSFAAGQSAPRELDLTLAGPAVIELSCGIVVGMGFRLVFAAAEVLASLLGHSTGLATPSVLNPTMEAPETVVARVIGLGAMLAALAAGVHRIAIAGLLESFHALPVGTFAIVDAPLPRLVDLSIDAFVLGVRLSTPIVAVALLVQLALALVSRAAPSLQIFNVGLTVLLGTGVLSILACLDDMFAGVLLHFSSLATFIDEAVFSMRR
jgi:flagellar biosynthesis protein FliR